MTSELNSGVKLVFLNHLLLKIRPLRRYRLRSDLSHGYVCAVDFIANACFKMIWGLAERCTADAAAWLLC
jgi:hypothetical protein